MIRRPLGVAGLAPQRAQQQLDLAHQLGQLQRVPLPGLRAKPRPGKFGGGHVHRFPGALQVKPREWRAIHLGIHRGYPNDPWSSLRQASGTAR
jgi:hypothetical protein